LSLDSSRFLIQSVSPLFKNLSLSNYTKNANLLYQTVLSSVRAKASNETPIMKTSCHTASLIMYTPVTDGFGTATISLLNLKTGFWKKKEKSSLQHMYSIQEPRIRVLQNLTKEKM
jgi:hypothetical protein